MQTLLSSLVRRRHVMRTTLLFSSLAQKRAGVGVGFRSVLMSAMTDLNICTHKLPKNFLCRRLQAKPRGPPLPKRAYEISNLPKDFKISAKISDFSRFSKRLRRFQRRFQDFTEDFRFREDFCRFQDFT